MLSIFVCAIYFCGFLKEFLISILIIICKFGHQRSYYTISMF